GHAHQVAHVGEVVGDDHPVRRLVGHYRGVLRVRLPFVSGRLDRFFSPRARRIGSSSGTTSSEASSRSSAPSPNGSLMSSSYSGSSAGSGGAFLARTGRADRFLRALGAGGGGASRSTSGSGSSSTSGSGAGRRRAVDGG